MIDDRHARLAAARLYFVSGPRPGGRPLDEVLPRAVAGGVDVFQLRCKETDTEGICAAAEIAREVCEQAGVLFILNDRPDLVERVGADGVHVGQDDAPVADARAIVGDDRIVGQSTHSPPQIAGAVGADYIGVGPVHPTPTKPWRPAVGLDLVRHAAAHARMPFFAIGGIDASNVSDVVGAGAARIAVVRAVGDAGDPAAAARSLRAALETVPLEVGGGAA